MKTKFASMVIEKEEDKRGLGSFQIKRDKRKRR